jgi:hypothetical protein
MNAMTARRELEIHIKWATENPLLFAEKVHKFHQETSDFPNRNMDISVPDYVTYSAWKDEA